MKKIQDTTFYKLLFDRNSIFISSINSMIKYCEDFLPHISRVFSNYTRHDIEHSFNVLQYMYHLCYSPDTLNDYEITLIIFSALLHDIGMVASDNEISDIKNDKVKISNRKYSLVMDYLQDENLALQECIRPCHALRSKTHIMDRLSENISLYIPGTNIHFYQEVANICYSHCNDFEWLKSTDNLGLASYKGNYYANNQFIAILLRLADYLDIDNSRAPNELFSYLSMNDFSKTEWQMNISIENTCDNKIVTNSVTGLKEIILYGETSNPTVHRKLMNYIISLENEIKKAVEYSKMFNDSKYLIKIYPKVLEYIKPKNFTFSNYKINLDYNSVTNLLMGEHIYGSKKYGLRELIQNAIDACNLMKGLSEKVERYQHESYKPYINIIFDRTNNEVIIRDNGKGMTLNIIKNHFLNVGVSYYSSDDFKYYGYNYKPIGKYGIGFISCFMLSDKVNVRSKHYNENDDNLISFEKNNEYISISIKNNPGSLHGTDIKLNYDSFMAVFGSIDEVRKFIYDNFINCGIPMKISVENNGSYLPEEISLKEFDVSKYCIDLSDYLDDIEVLVDASISYSGFINSLEDIEGTVSYTYDVNNNNVLMDSSNASIMEYLENGCVNYIKLPIIDENISDDFETALSVLDDFEEALTKVAYSEVLIFTNQNDYIATTNISITDNIINNYSFNDFVNQFHHKEGIDIYSSTYKEYIISNNTDTFLTYGEDVPSLYRWRLDRTDYTYVRNVYISKIQLRLPYVIRGVNIKSIFINIKNKSIFPELSRNEINTIFMQKINNAIGKALHLWIIDNQNKLDDNKKDLLKKFINEKYTMDDYMKKTEGYQVSKPLLIGK